jgi:hypothetical protein
MYNVSKTKKRIFSPLGVIIKNTFIMNCPREGRQKIKANKQYSPYVGSQITNLKSEHLEVESGSHKFKASRTT